MYKVRIQLFKTNRKIKTWDDIITEFNLEIKDIFPGCNLLMVYLDLGKETF